MRRITGVGSNTKKLMRRLELVARNSREDTIFPLSSRNVIGIAAGAEQLQISEEEFVKKMTEAGYQVPA